MNSLKDFKQPNSMLSYHNSTELQFMPLWPSKESKSFTWSVSVQWKTTNKTHTQKTPLILFLRNVCEITAYTAKLSHSLSEKHNYTHKHQLCRNSSTPFIEFSSTRTCESHSDQHIPQDTPFVHLSQDMIRHCKPLPDFTCATNL